jgi:predicted MFS family arabinose efflux permease
MKKRVIALQSLLAYSLFTFFSTTGFAVFTLIAYHLKVNSIVSDSLIPAFYAGAMIVDGIAALIVGKLYDKKGLNLLVLTPIITAPIAFTVFSKNIILIVIGVLFWGIVMGIHETIMKAAIADLTHINKRGLGYGLFNAIYGVSMLIGGGVMGFLYDSGNIILVGAFSLSMEIIAMIIFFYFFKKSFNFE